MYVHIFNNTNHKFSEPFFDFIERNFDIREHLFLIVGDYSINEYRERENLVVLPNLKKEFGRFLKILKSSKKIFLHQLFFSSRTLLFLNFQRKILEKTYWVLWGGDLYFYIQNRRNFTVRLMDFVRKRFIRNIRGIVTFVRGDYELAKQHYKTKANYYYAFYPNPVDYKYLDALLETANKDKGKIVVLVGNSADPSNKHIEVFQKLEKFKANGIKVVCPLSYGGKVEYTEKVIREGSRIFGENFEPLTDFLKPEEYGKILKDVDVAVFNHDRQQGLGNILALLYLGKKVYIKSTVTTWKMFEEKGVKVFDTYNLGEENFESFFGMSDEDRKHNHEIIKSEFSAEKCVYYWKKLFED